MSKKRMEKAKRGGKLAICLGLLSLGAASYCTAAQEAVTAWAENPIKVDSSVGPFLVASGPQDIKFSSSWCIGDTLAEGAQVQLKVVSDPDTANAVTTSVSLVEALEDGFVAYEGDGYLRFLLEAELDGEKIGETLVRDVSFGTTSSFSDEVAFDGRREALQVASDNSGSVKLYYDLGWADGAESAEIYAVRELRRRNGALVGITTNKISIATPPESGAKELDLGNLLWGRYVLHLKERAANGEALLEWQSPEFSVKGDFGLKIFVK